MMPTFVDVILDTNILIAALRSKRGASYRLLRLLGASRLRPNVSVALALEYEEVIKRNGPVLGLSEADADHFLDYIFTIANLVPRVHAVQVALPDPDDVQVLSLASETGAMIVTFNRRHYPEAERLGVVIMNPSEVLRYIEKML